MRYLLLLLAISALGCSYEPNVYAPSVHLVPGFDDAGQVTVGGHVGTSGLDVQAAWSPVRHVYLHGSGSFDGNRNDSTGAHAWHRSWGAGIGAYYALPATLSFDAAAGYGAGSAAGNGYTTDDCLFCPGPSFETGTHQSGYYERHWGQLAIAATVVPLTEQSGFSAQMIVVARLTSVHFPELFDQSWEKWSFDSVATVTSRTIDARGAFADWVLGVRWSAAPLLADVRIGTTWNTDNAPFDVVGFQLAIGMSVRLDQLLR